MPRDRDANPILLSPPKDETVTFRTNYRSKKRLTTLCRINRRSQRDVIEILIDRAYKDYTRDKGSRLAPPVA